MKKGQSWSRCNRSRSALRPMRNVARRAIYASSPAEFPQNKKAAQHKKKTEFPQNKTKKTVTSCSKKHLPKKKEGQHLTRADKTIVLQVRYD